MREVETAGTVHGLGKDWGFQVFSFRLAFGPVSHQLWLGNVKLVASLTVSSKTIGTQICFCSLIPGTCGCTSHLAHRTAVLLLWPMAHSCSVSGGITETLKMIISVITWGGHPLQGRIYSLWVYDAEGLAACRACFWCEVNRCFPGLEEWHYNPCLHSVPHQSPPCS